MTDDIKEMYAKARKAFEVIESWSQEKVDEMVAAIGWEWQKPETAKAMARLAVDEFVMGVYDDKIAKIQSKTRGTVQDLIGQKTFGLTKEDKEKSLGIFVKPMDDIADVAPCTNPESTVCCIGLSILKTRNAMIVLPHPRTQGSSYLTVEYARKALMKIGAPVDLLQCIEETSREKTKELMASCDFAVAVEGTTFLFFCTAVVN